jgi:hypothetical protein
MEHNVLIRTHWVPMVFFPRNGSYISAVPFFPARFYYHPFLSADSIPFKIPLEA